MLAGSIQIGVGRFRYSAPNCFAPLKYDYHVCHIVILIFVLCQLNEIREIWLCDARNFAWRKLATVWPTIPLTEESLEGIFNDFQLVCIWTIYITLRMTEKVLQVKHSLFSFRLQGDDKLHLLILWTLPLTLWRVLEKPHSQYHVDTSSNICV